MANTFTKIATVTVGSGGASSISFSSIPSTYTDLCLLISARNKASNYGGFQMKFNGSTVGTNVTQKRLMGDGSSASSNTSKEVTWNLNNDTANTFANIQIYIPNYTSSNNKSASIDAVRENNATTAITMINAWLWSQTSAITQIELGTFDAGFPNDIFDQYSTATLYGISNS